MIPFVVILLTVMFAFVAFAVDVGYMAVARQEMVNAADAGAYAGASKLYNEAGSVLGQALQDDAQRILARTEARTFAALNGLRARDFNQQTFTVPDADIELGVIAESNNPNATFTVFTGSPVTVTLSNGQSVTFNEANSVRVTTRRETGTNGELNLFFGRLLRKNSNPVRAQAVASKFVVNSFRPEGGGDMLPYALDIKIWRLMIQANNPTVQDILDAGLQNILPTDFTDNFRYNDNLNPTTQELEGNLGSGSFPNFSGRVSNGSDSRREFSMFPLNTTSGNFSTVDIGRDANSTDALREQILNGATEAQMNQILSDNSQTGALSTPFNTGGDPGISAGQEAAVTVIKGMPRMLPLYDRVSGEGNNTEYRIVAFVGVTIVDFDFQGNTKFIRIQPTIVETNGGNPGGGNNFVFSKVQLTK